MRVHNQINEKIEAEPKTKECANCGSLYTLKKGPPDICWVCGLPTEEKINEI